MSGDHMNNLNGVLSEADLTMATIDTTLGGEKISLSRSYGVETIMDWDDDGLKDDPVILLGAQHELGMSMMWIWQARIPKERWRAGVIESSGYSDEGGSIGFTSYYMKGAIAGMQFFDVWLEAVTTDGSITVENPGEICDDGPCDKAVFSFDLNLIGLRAKIATDDSTNI